MEYNELQDVKTCWKDTYYTYSVHRNSKHLDKYLERLDKASENLKKNREQNKNSYVLDLGGGNGMFGAFISSLIGAKGVVCYDLSPEMLGKKENQKFFGQNVEYYCDSIEKAIELQTERNFCFVLLKEVIHFTGEKFFKDLLDFSFKKLHKGNLLICGGAELNYWEEKPFWPKTALRVQDECMGTCYFFEIYDKFINQKEDFSKKLESPLDIENFRDVKYSLEILPHEMEFEINTWKNFVKDKIWSNFKICSDEELDLYIQSLEHYQTNFNFKYYFSFFLLEFL